MLAIAPVPAKIVYFSLWRQKILGALQPGTVSMATEIY